MVAFDTSHDTDWTYSNNDKTATHPNGNSQQFLKLNEGITIAGTRGTAYYIEFHTNNGDYSGDGYIYGYNQDSPAEQNVLSGFNDTWYINLDPEGTGDKSSQWQVASSTDRLQLRGVPPTTTISDGDVISVLIDFADYGTPYEYLVHAWYNGVAISTVVAGGFDNWSENVLYLGARFQDNNSIEVTVVDDPDDWVYDASTVWPWLQAYSSTPQTPSTPYNGYAKVRPSIGLSHIGTSSISQTFRHSIDVINEIEVRPPISSSDSGYHDMYPARAFGKYYFELEVESVKSSGFQFDLGVSNCEANVGGGGSDIRRMMYRFGPSSDEWYFSNGDTTQSESIGTIQPGDIIMMAFDLSNDIDDELGTPASTVAYVGVNGTWADSMDPSAGTGGKTLDSRFTASVWHPRLQVTVSSVETAFKAVWNGGHKAFNYSLPTGYSAWSDGS